MNWDRVFFSCLVIACGYPASVDANEGMIDPSSELILQVPSLSSGEPRAGKRVAVTPVEYAGTDVFHTLYLPQNWQRNVSTLPIIFEYTGNYFPRSGSTGEPEDAALGFCLSAGEYIWVSLPYVESSGKDNEITWWGDTEATLDYAKLNVPRIINEFGADPNAVFLCGFSRGAIGVNYLGLHDGEIAGLWTAFVSHDHFDGVKSWKGTTWGSPLKDYRAEAVTRLNRVKGRPYLVSQNGAGYGSESFVRESLGNVSGFTFMTIKAGEIFGVFPNEVAKSPHTDRWLVKPSKYRSAAWEWMNRASGREPVDIVVER
ncbi:MAG: hypothetical protein ACR2NZ_23310 [Rubripirellula sp.]